MKRLTFFIISLLSLFALPLHAQEIIEAVKQNNIQRVDSLIRFAPQTVNYKDDRNCTPLHYASDRGNLEIINNLIEKGADILARDADGDTPLHWAAFAGQKNVVNILLQRGVDINIKNTSGETPIDYAVRRSRFDVVEFLLDKGAVLNTDGSAGVRFLHQAAAGGSKKIVDLMINQLLPV